MSPFINYTKARQEAERLITKYNAEELSFIANCILSSNKLHKTMSREGGEI